MMQQIVFYAFAGILLLAAVGVIGSRNSVHAALYLVLAFFTSAAIWLLLEAEFLAITLVLVYVGAVMVLFLFVVMMLNVDSSSIPGGFTRYLPLGAVISILIAAELAMVLGMRHFGPEAFPAPLPRGPEYSNTEALGLVLYTDYAYPFEIAAVILLVAMVAAIALTLRRRPGVKSQRPDRQVAVRREDRVRLVKMATSERKDGGGAS